MTQTVLDHWSDQYDHWMTLSDRRMDDLPLMSSPLPTVGLVVSYLIGIKVLQNFMAKRQEVNVKPFLILYNLALVVLSLWMSVEGFRNAWARGFTLVCNSVDYSMEEHSVALSRVLYVFYLSKFLEFTDTIVMVLRKRNNQVTFLHLYHHFSMPLLWWIGARFVAGGDSYLSASLNSFVHVLMYSHYLAAAVGAGDLWWKPYLTQFQMAQFFFNFGLSLLAVFGLICTDPTYNFPQWMHKAMCGFPQWMHKAMCGCTDPTYNFPQWMYKAMCGYMASLLILFGNFYVKSYLEKKNRRTKTKNN